MLPQAKHYSDSGYFFLSRPGYAGVQVDAEGEILETLRFHYWLC